MPTLSSIWTNFFPPKPTFSAERELPDLKGKTYIVTGGNSGIGRVLVEELYKKNAKIYVAARSFEKAQEAVKSIRDAFPSSTGSLVFLHLDLNDLTNVKTAAESFLTQEKSLDTLFNNAGTMVPPVEPPPRTAQGYELALGVNCVGTLLFTKLLTPILATTARSSLPHSVRIVWPTSFAAELRAEADIGISTENLDYHTPVDSELRYALSKTGVWALGVEYGRRHKHEGIVSIAINPGNLSTNLPRDQGFALKFIAWLVCYPAALGAVTTLYAAFSSEAAASEQSKTLVGPWGRILPLREDLCTATLPENEGGTGGTRKFYDWCEAQIKPYT